MNRFHGSRWKVADRGPARKHVDPTTVMCPTCKVPPGSACVFPRGRSTPARSHRTRRRLAEQRAALEEDW